MLSSLPTYKSRGHGLGQYLIQLVRITPLGPTILHLDRSLAVALARLRWVGVYMSRQVRFMVDLVFGCPSLTRQRL